jgi:hypothetical protein
LAAAVAGGEGNFFEEAFEDGVEAAGADVFDAVVDVGGEVGEGVDGVFGEGEVEAFGADEGAVLLDQAVFGFGEDAAEVVAGRGGRVRRGWAGGLGVRAGGPRVWQGGRRRWR